MDFTVTINQHQQLWAQQRGAGSPVLLIMGANASGITWPESMVEELAARHHVIRYDHRDTGRSTWDYENHPYPIRQLAEDAIAVLDAAAVERAHVVGMSLGGYLTQLIVADHADRLLSAAVFGCSGISQPSGWDQAQVPGPKPELVQLWESMGRERTAEAEMAWRLEHWRLLNGGAAAFDPVEFENLERAVTAHAGRFDSPTAHAVADQSGMERDLLANKVPFLVIEGLADPVTPPPTADFVLAGIGNSRKASIPLMGHALSSVTTPEITRELLRHFEAVDGTSEP